MHNSQSENECQENKEGVLSNQKVQKRQVGQGLSKVKGHDQQGDVLMIGNDNGCDKWKLSKSDEAIQKELDDIKQEQMITNQLQAMKIGQEEQSYNGNYNHNNINNNGSNDKGSHNNYNGWRGRGRGRGTHNRGRNHHHQTYNHQQDNQTTSQHGYNSNNNNGRGKYCQKHTTNQQHTNTNLSHQQTKVYQQPHYAQSTNINRQQETSCGRKRQHRRNECKNKNRNRKRSNSTSHSRSSSSQSQDQQCSRNRESYQVQMGIYYEHELAYFFQSRQIKQRPRLKIVNAILYHRPTYQQQTIPYLLSCLQYIQQRGLSYKMPYLRIVKVILKFNFNIEEVEPRLLKIQAKRVKKFQADTQFQQVYGEQVKTGLLDVDELINRQTSHADMLYLIDGNNVIPTSRNLRLYFQSYNKLLKIQSQIRLRWLISHAFHHQHALLFFDEKYDEESLNLAKFMAFPSKEEQIKSQQIGVIYGQGQKADTKILQYLQSLKESNDKRQIILVSADRQLSIKCRQIMPIVQTSGKYFIKYCKNKMGRKYKGIKPMKGMAMRIIKYRQE